MTLSFVFNSHLTNRHNVSSKDRHLTVCYKVCIKAADYALHFVNPIYKLKEFLLPSLYEWLARPREDAVQAKPQLLQPPWLFCSFFGFIVLRQPVLSPSVTLQAGPTTFKVGPMANSLRPATHSVPSHHPLYLFFKKKNYHLPPIYFSYYTIF